MDDIELRQRLRLIKSRVIISDDETSIHVSFIISILFGGFGLISSQLYLISSNIHSLISAIICFFISILFFYNMIADMYISHKHQERDDRVIEYWKLKTPIKTIKW